MKKQELISMICWSFLLPGLASAQVFTLDEAVDCVVLGAKQFDEIGREVVSVGDVIGDGLCDLMSYSLNTDTPLEEEYGYLISGTTDYPSVIDLADMNSPNVHRIKGVDRVGSVGDFDNDGIRDYAVADIIRYVTNVGVAGEALILNGSILLPREIIRDPDVRGFGFKAIIREVIGIQFDRQAISMAMDSEHYVTGRWNDAQQPS
jgi:hypothetical protein